MTSSNFALMDLLFFRSPSALLPLYLSLSLSLHSLSLPLHFFACPSFKHQSPQLLLGKKYARIRTESGAVALFQFIRLVPFASFTKFFKLIYNHKKVSFLRLPLLSPFTFHLPLYLGTSLTSFFPFLNPHLLTNTHTHTDSLIALVAFVSTSKLIFASETLGRRQTNTPWPLFRFFTAVNLRRSLRAKLPDSHDKSYSDAFT